MTIPEQAVQAATLWAVNIHGPDDLIAATDYLSAVRMANAFNAWWLNLKMKQPHNDAIDARMWAVPSDWPANNAQGHADELSKPHPEYQWLRDVSAAPHLAAVQVEKLEWGDARITEDGREAEDAKSPVGRYIATDTGWFLLGQTGYETERGLYQAKSAAQADYEARILSALEPSAGRAAVLEEAAKLCDLSADMSQNQLNKEQYPVVRDALRGEVVAARVLAKRIRALHPQADKPSDDGAQGIERGKFYHHQWPMEKLLEARRDGLVDHSGGEAWRYEYSHKDENGKYDILYRPVTNSTIPARLPTPPAGEVA